jgi:hypothetical protein
VLNSGAFLALALALVASGCASGRAVISAERPGTSVKVTNPNAGKWTSVRLTRQPQNVSLYACKPLACAGNAAVAVQITRSSVRNPDRIALEKAAKLLPAQTRAQDVMMEAASEGDERQVSLSSKVTEVRGYPAIIAETKRTSRGKASFLMRGELFIGEALIKLSSQSTTREEAKRNFDEFVAILEIVDFPPTAADAPRTEAAAVEPSTPAAMSGQPSQ